MISLIPISSCKIKEDLFAPVITLNTDDVTHNRVPQFSTTNYSDPGATAYDDVDGNVIVIPNGIVNMNLAGDYVISYIATDKAGNKSTKNRTVTVDGGYYITGNYLAEDFDSLSVSNGTYHEVISASLISKNRINFENFGKYVNDTVYGTCLGTTITIPIQTVSGGSPPTARTFQGTGTYNSANKIFTITFTEITNGDTISKHDVYTPD